MIECSIKNISKSFGADKIFENISFKIKTNEKIGLIGPNGVGKSTVLKILMGKEDYMGTIAFKKGVIPGYLEQSPEYDYSHTGASVLNLAFEEISLIKSKMEKLEVLMIDSYEIERIMEEYAELQTQYELLGGYDIQEKLSKVIKGLKINDSMLKTSFNSLSGGEKTKIILGKILLEEPPLLLLDEPSNHLDLSTMEWLENYISEYNGAVVIVSHDRYFLDKAVNKIIELSANKAYVFHGNYSYFVEEKRKRYENELKEYKQNQKDIKKVEDQIKRYRIWGAMRDSDKMYAQAKQLERKLDKMEKLDKPILENKRIKLSTKEAKRTGKDVLFADNLSKSFGNQNLFTNLDLKVFYRDSIGIIGDNGCGKSTLLKILLSEIKPDMGIVKYGTNINMGYIAQDITFDDEDKSILEYFQYKYNINNSTARFELSKVLFTGDDVFKKIRVLSGGEKSRLRLCSLMYEKVNLMVLDEPTNHLDIESREILEDILRDYIGTIVFVSHDRYFISKIAKKINVLQDGKLEKYNGNYEYYISEIARRQELKSLINAQKTKTKSNTKTKSEKTIRENKVERLQIKINKLEGEIANIEDIINKLNDEMHKFGDNLEKLSDLEQLNNSLKDDLESKITSWETMLSELEELQ